MRTGIVLSIVAMLNMVVFVPAVRADVIPTKVPVKTDPTARGMVEQRLVELGVDQNEARAQVADLPDNVALHYAQSPNSIQIVSGIYLEEAVLGTALLALLGGVYWGIVQDADDD